MDTNEVEIRMETKQENYEVIDGKKVHTFYGHPSAWERIGAHLLTGIITGIPYLGFLFFIFHAISYLGYGKGIGYSILGYRVIDEKTAEKPGGGRLFVRGFYKYCFFWLAWLIAVTLFVTGMATELWVLPVIALVLVSVVVLVVAIIYLRKIATTPKKQAPHDSWTKTIVVKERPGDTSTGAMIAVIIGMVIVGIAVVGILSAVVLTSLSGARELAQDSQVTADVQQIALALEIERNAETGEYASGAFIPAELRTLVGEINPDIRWIDNSQDPSKYCVYAELSDDIDSYYVASQDGSGYEVFEPESLNECYDPSYDEFNFGDDFGFDDDYDNIDFDRFDR